MTAQTSIYGRLTADPQSHQTRTGTAMTSAKMAVDLPCKDDPEGKATWWVSLVAFGKQAELLASHRVIPPFLGASKSRCHAAFAKCCFGV